MEIFWIGEDHCSLRNNLLILPCFIAYIFIETVNFRKLYFIHPHTGKCRNFYPLFFLSQDFGTGITHCKFYKHFTRRQSLICHIQADRFLKFEMLTVHIRFHRHPALLLAGKHYRHKEPLSIIMKSFPSSIIING